MPGSNIIGHDDPASRRRPIVAAVTVAVVHGVIGYAFLTGLGTRMSICAPDVLKTFDVLPDPPPPAIPAAPHRKSARRQGASSPLNLKSQATEIVASTTPALAPPPIVAAPVADRGSDPSAGASSVRGPGAGSGGQGAGAGSGRSGDGDGDGGTPLRWRDGRIKDSDYPRGALEAGASGIVTLRFTVGVNGRVTDCAVTASSGNAELDDTTCRLIRQRFRYTPSTDAAGRPVPDTVTGQHEWTLYRPDDGPPGG